MLERRLEQYIPHLDQFQILTRPPHERYTWALTMSSKPAAPPSYPSVLPPTLRPILVPQKMVHHIR